MADDGMEVVSICEVLYEMQQLTKRQSANPGGDPDGYCNGRQSQPM